jgi:hypothetical protein
MGNSEPSLCGLTEVGEHLVESLPLGVTAGQCGNGGGVAPGLGFRTDKGGEDNGDAGQDKARGCAKQEGSS